MKLSAFIWVAAVLLLLAALLTPLTARAGEAEPGDIHSGRAAGFQDYISRHGDETTGIPSSFIALCYHDISDKDADQRFDGVSTDKFIQQLSWLQQNGYHPVSLSDILAARAGTRPLPSKPVLLTFDDGYESVYTRVFPILKAFNYPAVIGLVQEWLSGPLEGTVKYGTAKIPRRNFLTWPQIKEIQNSGLIEIASHTGYLHTGITANPQGNTEPSAVTAAYDPKTGRYESPAAHEARLARDARLSSDAIYSQTGRRPRAVIWPYGEYNQQLISIYGATGMPITFSLADGVAKLDHLEAAPRLLVVNDPDLGEYAPDIYHIQETPIARVAHVDLDYVYDPDPAQQERNLSALIQRIYNLDINVVFLQAFADPGGSGTVNEVYFPNHLLHMRADLFNRVAWQLRTRANVAVYAWLPVLSYNFGPRQPTEVMAWNPKTNVIGPSSDQYHRLSPFDPKARALIGQLYEELAQAAPIAGILFHDDAELSDFEDVSPAALAAYQAAGLPASISELRSPSVIRRWTSFKTNALITFTQELANRVRVYRSPLKTARNIYSRPILDPRSEEWMAQNFDSFIQSYDYTAIEAMPLMEGVSADNANDWLTNLVAKVKTHRGALNKTIFELQAVDWRMPDHSPSRIVGADTLVDEMHTLQRLGAMNFGYYPDDFLNDQPNARTLHTAISLQAYEYKK